MEATDGVKLELNKLRMMRRKNKILNLSPKPLSNSNIVLPRILQKLFLSDLSIIPSGIWSDISDGVILPPPCVKPSDKFSLTLGYIQIS